MYTPIPYTLGSCDKFQPVLKILIFSKKWAIIECLNRFKRQCAVTEFVFGEGRLKDKSVDSSLCIVCVCSAGFPMKTVCVKPW